MTINSNNLIITTDGYKLTHWNQYPPDTEGVYSYFESRDGARYPATVFFGLQAILKQHNMIGSAISWNDVTEAGEVARAYFGNNTMFNYKGWAHIMEKHGGRLPLRIRAVPEGVIVPTGNVLMTVESTDPECYWLTNAFETLLTHVWYTSTVATLSHDCRPMFERFLRETSTLDEESLLTVLSFMLHDFGMRGASSEMTAERGGAAHLLNFLGTDTVPAIPLLHNLYNAPLVGIAYSVPATEHSGMTARGEGGEDQVISQVLDTYPTGIVSIVGDSFDIYRFTRAIGSTFKARVLARTGADGTGAGKTVVRPDSTTPEHPTPEALVVWIANQLWADFGGTTNAKGYKVLDPHVGILWGDGLEPAEMEKILAALAFHSFSAEIIVFGMGGGLLQKVNRDTQRFAFKASAISYDGEWHDISKTTFQKSSKPGKLRLQVNPDGSMVTAREDDGYPMVAGLIPDLLETVFENGKLVRNMSLDEVRANVRRAPEQVPRDFQAKVDAAYAAA